ncbi:hypothetical protein KOR42_49790 [Thalassoglobus neptunius]|uniref:Uncharacterized protein n=1 Tax=Thalassoglobus neptunius TaxID=1938619 RepID=A0A5C5VQQ2_9PLAN|nr:PmoA family protein [Thalassoglobus neptunius]TWT40131.1 hypothetical protein KOR42_49790 [Thalassoglobus neptunius]
MRIFLTLAVVSLCSNFAFAAPVELKQNSMSVKATIDGEVFAVFNFDPQRKKPFVLPVTAPGGFEILEAAEETEEPGAAGRQVIIAEETPTVIDQQAAPEVDAPSLGDIYKVTSVENDRVYLPELSGWLSKSDVAPVVSTVTRLINDNPSGIKDRKNPLYYGHPHHKGVWLSVDEVNGIKFWNEDGIIRNVSVELVEASGNPAVIQVKNHWLDGEGEPLLEESTQIKIHANRLMTYDVTLKAVADEVEIGDTKEGMFAIRLPNSMREMISGGPVTNAAGEVGSNISWGRETPWIDYCGPIDGHVFGVTLMDHPQNPWKSRYHVRNYGLFAINPFGSGAYTKGRDDAQEAHHRIMKRGKDSLQFKYGLFVHADQVPNEEIQKVYEEFVESVNE